MLERTSNHGMPILTKNGGCSGDQASLRCDQGDKSPGAASNHEDYNHKGKSRREQNDETNRVASRPDVIKSGLMNSSPAEKMSPKVGKPSYNPITHVSSRSLCLPVVFFIPILISSNE